MKTRLVTALYDIDREKKGDGRTVEEYLKWMKETLKIKCDISVYTEKKFYNFILENRTNGYDCDIIIDEFTKIPFYKYNNRIKEIINSEEYKSKMNDTRRIECYLSEYNIIQYSKFDWIKRTIDKYSDYQFYFWVDAGISRFFDGFDLNKEWPDMKKIDVNKIVIQGNDNFKRFFDNLKPDTYIWDNKCLLSGGIFGGGKQVMIKLKEEVDLFVDFLFSKNCFNNEQFAFPIIMKKNPKMFNVIMSNNLTPMPIFKMIS